MADVKRSRIANRECSVARAMEAIGDRWSILLLREAYYGVKRFDEFQYYVGIAPNILSTRLKKLVDAGVPIAMGTDTGPPARFQGYFEHMELELMEKAGLTPAQVLKAATAGAANCLGMAGKIGTLQPGAWGDVLVLSQDPLAGVKNIRSIESVWIAGNKVGPR